MPAGQQVDAVSASVIPVGYEQINPAAATGLTVPATAEVALIQAEGGKIRWRDDGTTPTGAIGMLVADGETLQYNGDLDAFELIADGTAAATAVNVSYYRYV